MAGPIEIGIRTDSSQARRDLSTTDRSFARLGQNARRAGAAAAAGLAVAVVAAGKLAKGAAEDQLAATRMAAALRTNTGATDAQVAATERWIVAQGKAFGVADDDLRPAIAKLATATGDVGKAQRLTSIAMDVAAGRNIKLAAVTTALEKAQNGSLGGLARLGVRTKNAAGETLTLDEVTRNLAKTYRGQAAKSAETASGQYERLSVMINEAGEGIGYTLLPAATELAQFIQSRGVPTLESYWQTFERGGTDAVVSRLDDFVGAGGRVEDVAGEVERSLDALWRIAKEVGPAFADAAEGVPAFLSPLKSLDSILSGVADGLEAIPDPVKEIGVQAGVAALIMPRLAAGVSATTAAMATGARTAATYYTVLRGGAATSTQAAAAATRLASAARTAAGIGGMVALSQATQQTNDNTSVLLNTIGGAALGFSVAGPYGALAGAAGGAALGIVKVQNAHEDAADAARRSAVVQAAALRELTTGAREYRDTLDSVTGALTRQTREAAVRAAQDSGALALSQRLGIADRDLVGAILGREGATRRLNAALNENADALTGPEQEQFNTFLRNNAGAFARQQDEAAEAAGALRSFKAATRGLPPKLVTELRADGAELSIRKVQRLKNEYNLTDRQVKTLMQVNGTEIVIRKVKGVYQLFRDGKRLNPNLQPWLLEMERGLNRGERTVKNSMGTLDQLFGGAGNTRADLGPFNGSIRDGLSRARGTAASGAPSVGNALADGVAAGVRTRANAIGAEAVGAVTRAIRAAKYAARVASPSRRTRDEIGKPLADGIIVGIRSRQAAAQSEASKFVRGVIAAAQRGGEGTSTIRDRITALVEKSVDLKDDGAERKRERAILAGLRQRFRLLEENGRAQDRVNRKLDAARQKYQSLVAASRQYAASVKSTVVSFGSFVGLGAVEGGPPGAVSLTLMLDELRAKAAQAERFNDLLRTLSRPGGLSQAAVNQLAAAGPEALGTLEAINRGGDAAITEVNRLTASIARSGDQLGDTLATRYHSAGIQAAAGVVAGLQARSRQLDRAAANLARALVKAMRRELGIKSPSTVFKSLGDLTVRGLEIGLDETRARSAGAKLATGVKAGYGRPDLSTSATGGARVDGPLSQPLTIIIKPDRTALQAGRDQVVTVDLAKAAGVRTLAVR